MIPYGLPRNDDVAHPDCADVLEYGLASRRRNLPGPGGDTHNSVRNPAAKARARRRFARHARAAAKATCREET